MARRISSRISKVRTSSFSSSSSSYDGIMDWVISILLVVAIVALAFGVCNNPEHDSTDTEPFWSTTETFANVTETVTMVTSDTQLETSVNENDIGCCLVYYERCGHCQNYKPTWKKVCKGMQGKRVNGKTVKMFQCGDDGDPNVWRTVSNRYGVQGYPSILVKVGGQGARWQEYGGPRDKLQEYLENVQ